MSSRRARSRYDFETCGGLAMVAVGSPERLGDDLVDDAQAQQVAAGHLEGLGGCGACSLPFQRIVAHPSGLMTE